MIIISARTNAASANIAEKLLKRGVKVVETNAPTILDVPTDFDTDCLLVLSTHKSKNPVPMLTVHHPGNWGNAEMGGEPKTLNNAYPSMIRRLYLALKEANEKNGLTWEVCVEADHHGPTCDVPVIFVEIGSSEAEWNNEKAGEAVADAVLSVVRGQRMDAPTPFFGVGGGHYAREFCKLMEKENVAPGHILPKYAIDGVDETMLEQAISKSVEPTKTVILLKDSANSAQKAKIREFCAKKGLECREI